jgi:predicted PhzF superfamily epimerase YddE/YHI9
VTDVRSVNGQRVEPVSSVTQRRHDEGSAHLFAWQPSERLHANRFDLTAREQAQPPLAPFKIDSFAPRSLARGERPVLAEVEAMLTGQVSAPGLPRPAAPTRVRALGLGERNEDSRQAQARSQLFVEISTGSAPRFGADEYVRRNRHDRVEGAGGTTPPVDAGVKVERHNTHPLRLRERPTLLWQCLGVDSVKVTFGHRLWWVDAFIGDGARGNPAVVVLLERPMADEDLQQIAFELGVSETAFLRRVGDGWSLRWFTPTVEVDLCGHATLATLHVLLSELGVPGGEFYFQTRAGVLSGRRLRDGMLGIDLPRSYIEPLDASVLNGTLGPVRDVFQAGPSSVLAVVEDYDALCSLAIDPVSLFLVPSSLVIVACPDGPDADVSIRVFAPRLGLAEDHVTGSAMCAVAPWWMETAGSPTVQVRQASARGGVMFARLFERNVEVAGVARTFFGGDLRA